MRYILAPSSLAGRGLGVGFLYLITPRSAVSQTPSINQEKFYQKVDLNLIGVYYTLVCIFHR
jgi:hypothetical protein